MPRRGISRPRSALSVCKGRLSSCGARLPRRILGRPRFPRETKKQSPAGAEGMTRETCVSTSREGEGSLTCSQVV